MYSLMFGVVYEITTSRKRRPRTNPTARPAPPIETDQEHYRWVILAITVAMAFMIVGSRSTLGVFFKSIVRDL